MTRVDSTTGEYHDTSAHFVWIGDRQKEQMLEAMEAKQEELMKEVESIKEKYIADPKAREEYLLNIDPSLEDPSFLLRQSDSSPE